MASCFATAAFVTAFISRAKWAAIFAFALPALGVAQDTDGNDRPSNWQVTHQQAHGIWDTVCDERGVGEDFEIRCYIRHVEVFSPRPKFAAQFLFVTAFDGGEVEFGLEAGTLFLPGNFRLERDGEAVWSTLRPGCLTGLSCSFTGDAARSLLRDMRAGGQLAFDFRDRHGETRALRWSLDGFSAAVDDFNLQAADRNLPPLPVLP